MPLGPMLEIYDSLALACATAGVMVLLITFLSSGQLAVGIPLALDFWMASGFMKLSGSPSWTLISTSALLVVIRKVVVTTLKLNGTKSQRRSSAKQGSL